MKNKKFFAIGIPVLAVLLCAVIVVGIWHVMGQKDEKFDSGAIQSTTDPTGPAQLPPKDFQPEKFVETQNVLGKNEWLQFYHVMGDGKKVLFLNWISTPESMESPCYLWDRENGSKQMLSLGDYSASDLAWSGSELFITGLKQGSGAGLALFAGKIGEGAVENIRPVLCEDAGIGVFRCFAVWQDKILFQGNDGKTYLGTLRDDRIHDPQVLNMGSVEGKLSDAHFMNNGTKILVYIGKEWPGKGSWLFDMNPEKTQIQGEGTELSFCYIDKDMHSMPVLSIDDTQDLVYYMGGDKVIYKAALSAFINEGIAQAEKENQQQNQDYGYDAFDTGNFTSDLREKTDEETKQGVYYEIFVRAFADSDGDGIGDFDGITGKMDYLKDLGIDGLWLMPINASGSYHGYDISDYESLNSDYGTEEDFAQLLDAAHARGMKVIMDFPINHTSSDHPWFQAALADPTSEYRNYYRWVEPDDHTDYTLVDQSPWGSNVWWEHDGAYYYGIFGADMPDLNYNNPAVREAIKAAAGKWLELGVDGFRLDAAMHIYGANEFKQEADPTQSTLTWWNAFARYCESIDPDVYLVGEAWQGDEVLEAYVQPFDTKFNFAFQEHLTAAMINGSGQGLAEFLQNILETYEMVDSNYQDGVFGSNHDQNRIMSTLGDADKAKQMAAVYLTLPGNPYIYYGEELGMLGQKPDEMIRTPFLWGEGKPENTAWVNDRQNGNTPTLVQQMADENSMYAFYKRLIALCKSNKALTKGDFEAVDLNNDNLMVYLRQSEGQQLLVIHNFAEDSQIMDLQAFHVAQTVFAMDAQFSGDALTLGSNGSVILQLG